MGLRAVGAQSIVQQQPRRGGQPTAQGNALGGRRLRAWLVAALLTLGVVPLLDGCALRTHRAQPGAASDAVGSAVRRLLRSGADQDDHDAAVDAIAAMGDAAVPHLSRALADPDEDVRVVAIEALGRLRSPSAVDGLLAALADPSPTVRLSAVEALGTTGDRRATQPLMTQFAKDDNPQVRYECLTSLGLIGDPAAVGFLVKGVSDSDPFVRLWAMDALCQMHSPNAPELALRLLQDPNPVVRSHTIQYCGDVFDTPDGHRALIALALDADEFPTTVWARRHLMTFVKRQGNDGQLAEQIRASATKALHGPRRTRAAFLLGDLGDQAATVPLIEALHDPDVLVRHHAAYLLARVRDPRAVPPLILALADPSDLVAATAYNSLLWYADDGDPRARQAVSRYQGKRFSERLRR